MKRTEEVRLLNLARQGDADSFAALYHTHVQVIYRYIMYRVNDQDIAEDLTSEVFIRALEGLPKYTNQGKPFVSWLYRIAHARVVDFYRQSKRRPQTDIEAVPIAVQMDMDIKVMRRQAAQILREAIATLTDEQQQVIILRFVEGMSINEVASIMDKRANAIKALQHRGLRSLARHLASNELGLDELLEGLS